MTAVLMTPPYLQFFDGDGAPLAGGFVYTYTATGTFTVPKATYTTAAGNVEASNPIQLDGSGRPTSGNGSIWLSGTYDFKVTDSLNNIIETTQNVTAFTTLPSASDAYFESFSGNGTQTAFTTSSNLGTDEKAIYVWVNSGLAECTTNGTFASDTGWTKGAGWSIATGTAIATGAISTALSQTSARTIVAGQAYAVTYTITRSAGGLIPSVGGYSGTERTSAGTYSEVIVAGATQILAFTGNGFTGTLDNVSITVADSAGYEIQNPANYTISGTTLTFSSAPPTGTGNIYVSAPSLLVGAASSAAADAAASAADAAASASSAAADAIQTALDVIAADAAAVSAAASAASIDTLFKINVVTYGADPTGVADSSAAYASALAAANTQYSGAISPGLAITTGALYWPAGNYRIDTGGTVANLNLAMITEGKESVRIKLGAGQVFLTCTSTVLQFDCQNAFNVSGGLGFFQHTNTAANVNGIVNIVGNDYYGYTGACLGSLSVDFPYWKVMNNIFYGTTASKGVVLMGDNSKSTISGNEFLLNLYHIKLQKLGDALYISDNDFIRFSNGGGSPALTDIWIVPNSVAANSGVGTVVANNKFGNENLNTADYRILVADEGSGTNGFDKNHATSVSTGFAEGITFQNNFLNSVSNFTHGLVYSYTPKIISWMMHVTMTGSGAFPYVFQYDAGVSISGEDRTVNNNLVWFGSGVDATEQICPLISSLDSTALLVGDPLALAAGIASQPTAYRAGSNPTNVDILTSNLITGATMATASKSNITDSRSGANAITATYSGSTGSASLGLNLSNLVAGELAWIEVDLKQSSSLACTQAQISVRLDSGGNPATRRFIRIPTVWTTIRFPWIPKQKGSALSLAILPGDYSAAVKTNIDISLPRVYHSQEPIDRENAWLRSSATYNPPSLLTLTNATTTVTVTGAALGDTAECSFSLDTAGVMMRPDVTSANTVTVNFFNATSGTVDLGSGTLTAIVRKVIL